MVDFENRLVNPLTNATKEQEKATEMDEQKKIYDPHESVGFLLATASRRISLHLNRKFTRTGLDVSMDQWRVMLAIWMEEGLYQQELAERCLKNKVSITKILDSLQKRDLIVRKRSKRDRRGNRVYLTNRGLDMQEQLLALAMENVREASNGVTPEKLEIFKEVARVIIKNMQP